MTLRWTKGRREGKSKGGEGNMEKEKVRGKEGERRKRGKEWMERRRHR